MITNYLIKTRKKVDSLMWSDNPNSKGACYRYTKIELSSYLILEDDKNEFELKRKRILCNYLRIYATGHSVWVHTYTWMYMQSDERIIYCEGVNMYVCAEGRQNGTNGNNITKNWIVSELSACVCMWVVCVYLSVLFVCDFQRYAVFQGILLLLLTISTFPFIFI